jgi:hypothetical protein
MISYTPILTKTSSVALLTGPLLLLKTSLFDKVALFDMKNYDLQH